MAKAKKAAAPKKPKSEPKKDSWEPKALQSEAHEKNSAKAENDLLNHSKFSKFKGEK